MPYTIRKRKCRQSSGKQGSYVLSYTDKSGKKHNNCHTSKKKAKGQIAAIEAPRREGLEPIHDYDISTEDQTFESYSTLTHHGTTFRNPYEDPGSEFDIDEEDPIGLLRSAIRLEIDRQISGS